MSRQPRTVVVVSFFLRVVRCERQLSGHVAIANGRGESVLYCREATAYENDKP